MTLWRLFPSVRPRRTLESVVHELIDGLRDGSIVLPHTPGAAPTRESLCEAAKDVAEAKGQAHVQVKNGKAARWENAAQPNVLVSPSDPLMPTLV